MSAYTKDLTHIIIIINSGCTVDCAARKSVTCNIRTSSDYTHNTQHSTHKEK